MRLRRRFLTFSLAAAVAVTSLPGGMVNTVKAAELGAEQQDVQSGPIAAAAEDAANSLIEVYPSSDETIREVRMNGTATFVVDVDFLDTDICSSVDYQWYSVAKTGAETKMDKEVTDTLKVRVKEYDTSYKCVVTPRLNEGAPQGTQVTPVTRIFKVSQASGYKVNAISDRYTYLKAGEKGVLSFDAEVDSGYTLKYNWVREGGAASLGQGPSLEVAPQKSEDFQKGYSLTVTEEKDGKAVNTYEYSFYLREAVESVEWDSNEGTITIEPGAEASLYVKTGATTAYAVTRVWYKEVGSADFIRQYDGDTMEEVFLDPTKVPAQGSYDERVETSWWDEDDNRIYTYTYYKKVDENKDTLSLSSKKDNKYADITGGYMCRATAKPTGTGEQQPEIAREFMFQVECDSELDAYAKNPTVAAVVGGAAKLEVVAGNKDAQLCPITYKWEKKNAATGAYEEVKNASGQAENQAALSIAAVSDSSYGDYRVTVADGIQTQQVAFKLVKKEVDYIAYTPEYSRYSKAMDEKVDLKVDLEISEGTEVFYEWWRAERHYYNNYSYSYDNEDWELLDQSKETYSFTIKNERDYTDYKCKVTFKTVKNGENVSETKEFVFSVEKPYSFGLEATKPQTQYKKVGSSADYAVRLVTDNTAVTENTVTYQWYRTDEYGDPGEAIENAKAASYHVDALRSGDFGDIICIATYKDAEGKEQIAVKRFTTYRYTDAFLENDDESKAVAFGADVTLKPGIQNPSKEALTYQWYRYNTKEKYYDEYDDYEYWEYSDRKRIHGATGDSYKISQIGENEITRYECEVSIDGAIAFTYRVTLSEATEESGLAVEPKDGKDTVYAVLGKNAELAVTAVSSKGLALKYQWYKGRRAIGGATADSYKIAKVTNDSYGMYRCVVKDAKGNAVSCSISLVKDTGLVVGSEALYPEDYIGYEVTLGGTATLKASASSDASYEVFYQWYKSEDGGHTGKMLYGETNSTLKLANITESELGYYYCRVYDATAVDGVDDGKAETRGYYVYLNTGLVAVPSCKNVVASSNGSVKMFVKASANKGEKVSYQWSKWDGEEEVFADIAKAASANYSISKLKAADYGTYRCTVKTRGEQAAYDFYVYPSYDLGLNRQFAEQGDKITLNASITNPASDVNYTYTWYAQDPATGNYRKISGSAAKCSAAAPKLLQENVKNGYVSIGYRCVIGDKGTGEAVDTVQGFVNVLPKITYSTKSLPETSHPFDTAYDVKAYQVKGAKSLTVTFDAKTQLSAGERLYVIDKSGNYTVYGGYAAERDLDMSIPSLPKTLKVNGDRVVFLINGNSTADSYGYKVASIVMPVPGKGTSYTTGNITYKVTKSDAKNGTVAVSGVKTKNLTKASIKNTVKIQGYTFKVTAINAKAFKGCKKLSSLKIGANVKTIGASAFQSCTKLTKVTLGPNVTTIGKSAFQGCSKLKSVTIGKGVKSIGAAAFANDKSLKAIKVTSTVLKSVGKKAFTKVPKQAKATVPKSKKAAYAKLLKNGGFAGSVK